MREKAKPEPLSDEDLDAVQGAGVKSDTYTQGPNRELRHRGTPGSGETPDQSADDKLRATLESEGQQKTYSKYKKVIVAQSGNGGI